VREIDDGNLGLLAKSAIYSLKIQNLSVCLHYNFYIVDSDILEAIKSARQVKGKRKREKNNYLDSRLWQVDLEGNLLSHKDVWISRFRE